MSLVHGRRAGRIGPFFRRAAPQVKRLERRTIGQESPRNLAGADRPDRAGRRRPRCFRQAPPRYGPAASISCQARPGYNFPLTQRRHPGFRRENRRRTFADPVSLGRRMVSADEDVAALRVGDHMHRGHAGGTVCRDRFQSIDGREAAAGRVSQRLGTHDADPETGEASRPDAHRHGFKVQNPHAQSTERVLDLANQRLRMPSRSIFEYRFRETHVVPA